MKFLPLLCCLPFLSGLALAKSADYWSPDSNAEGCIGETNLELARPRSTFEGSLPVLKKYNVGAYNWGFVSGKTGTIWPWSSKKGINPDDLRTQDKILHPGEPFPEPKVWFHDIHRTDGTPCSQDEIDFIRHITADKRQENPTTPNRL